MAQPIPFLGVNKEVVPEHTDELSVPVKAKGNVWLSCWQLSEEELQKLVETGRLWIMVRGRTLPHLQLSADEIYEEL